MPYSDDELHAANVAVESALDELDPKETPAENTTDLRAIADAALAVEMAHAVLREQVELARARGRSWNRIAVPLGVSRQSARERFGGKSSGKRVKPRRSHGERVVVYDIPTGSSGIVPKPLTQGSDGPDPYHLSGAIFLDPSDDAERIAEVVENVKSHGRVIGLIGAVEDDDRSQ